MKFFSELFRHRIRSVCSRQPANGFTLVELMVVVACIGIMALAATPTLRQYLRMVNLRQAVYQISGDLYTVRSQAVKTGANCSITFTPGTPPTYALSNPNRIMDLSTYRGNVTFTANPDPGGLPGDVFSPTITFNARGLSGLVPPVTTQVYVTNIDNRIFRVQVTATGAVSVRLWDNHSNKWGR
jgi:prepilin-type N-terminal cleavage/methylation domain-containing protein